MKLIYPIIGAVALLLTSCFKNEQYPSTPAISYDEIVIMGDSAKLIFDFTDGEGDIGLLDSQTEYPYDFGSEYYYNVIVEYLEKDDMEGFKYVLNADNDTISFPIRIHPILDLDETKSIKGKIEVSLAPYFYNPTSSQSDTIKYRIQLIDRALNKSNWVESEEIIR